MKKETAKACVVFSGILLVTGFMMLSPAGALAVHAAAALVALIPAVGGSGRLRIAGIALVVLSVVFAAMSFPKYHDELQKLRQRTLPRAFAP